MPVSWALHTFQRRLYCGEQASYRWFKARAPVSCFIPTVFIFAKYHHAMKALSTWVAIRTYAAIDGAAPRQGIVFRARHSLRPKFAFDHEPPVHFSRIGTKPIYRTVLSLGRISFSLVSQGTTDTWVHHSAGGTAEEGHQTSHLPRIASRLVPLDAFHVAG